jgi:hypothetical protein
MSSGQLVAAVLIESVEQRFAPGDIRGKLQ